MSILELADILLDRTTEDEVGRGEIQGILSDCCPRWTDREQEEIAHKALNLLLELGLIHAKWGIPFSNDSHLALVDAKKLLEKVEIMAPVINFLHSEQITFVATDDGWDYYRTGRKLARDLDSGNN